MRKKSKTETGRAACTVLALCAALSLTACAGESDAARAGQNGEEAAVQAGQNGEAAAAQTGSNGEAVQARQDEEWLEERLKQDRRTKHDLRTEPEDVEKTERMDLDACEGGKIILSGGGDIWLSGSLEGQVIVDAQEDELVHLYLDGVKITSAKGPALWVREAAKVIVTLVSDTESVLTDSPAYEDCEEAPACLYSVCDLTINGDGALRVSGYYEDGVRSKDRIKVLDGTLSVQAKGDGIRGNDGIYMYHASVDIESEQNGLRTANQGAEDRGVIEVNGGTLSVIAGRNGFRGASDLYVYRGSCRVSAVEEKARTEGKVYISQGEQGL